MPSYSGETQISKILAAISALAMLTSTGSWAESVSVKDIGMVDLDTYSCQNTSSSYLHRVCYDSRRGLLVLLLNNTYYQHCNVPSSTIQSLLSASSKGTYFDRNIRGRYACQVH